MDGWIELGETSYDDDMMKYRCPSCQKVIWLVWWVDDYEYKFCPYCGKRSTGEKKTK